MKQITKSYLEYLGVTEVTADGKVFTKNGELKPYLLGRSKNNPHKQAKPTLNFYDPDKYKNTPKDKRRSSSGLVTRQVSHIVYAWFHNEVPYGKEIHHIDLNYLNNSIDNLEALTKSEHRAKHRGIKELKCRLDIPREWYQKQLEEAESIENKTKIDYNKISTYRAKLRYYDSHIKEAVQAQKDKKDLAMIKAIAKQEKEAQNLPKWHQINQIIKDWKSYDSDLKEKLIQVILKGHTFNV